MRRRKTILRCKIASSVDAALMAFHMSIQNKSFLPGEGIIRGDVEETIKAWDISAVWE